MANNGTDGCGRSEAGGGGGNSIELQRNPGTFLTARFPAMSLTPPTERKLWSDRSNMRAETYRAIQGGVVA